jgi:ATP phosphoribosyltransferase regulatory subunit
VRAIAEELERWGYRAIITPIYEYDAVLARGLADGGGTRAMRFVEPSSGEILALRPDLTPQVARLVATRLHDEPGPIRLYYEGSVVRMPDARELYQVGAELIDAPRPGGDFEAISMMEAALRAAGVGELKLDLGHAAVVRHALSSPSGGLGLDEDREAALHAALQKKDAARAAELVASADVARERRELVAALPSLYGGAEVIARARTLTAARECHEALDELEALVERLAATGARERLSIDLGEVRGFHYYTGTRFAAYADGAPGALCAGGRYDRLVERYGRAARATGFAVDVEALAALTKTRAPAPAQAGLLVSGDALHAARLAARLRSAGARAVLDLDGEVAADAALRERAARAELERVVIVTAAELRWFSAAGDVHGVLAGVELERLLHDDASPLDVLLTAR